jgi:hypothetical protein
MQQLHIFGNFVLLPVSIMERRTSLPVVVSRLMLHPCPIPVLFLPGLEVLLGLCIYAYIFWEAMISYIYI